MKKLKKRKETEEIEEEVRRKSIIKMKPQALPGPLDQFVFLDVEAGSSSSDSESDNERGDVPKKERQGDTRDPTEVGGKYAIKLNETNMPFQPDQEDSRSSLGSRPSRPELAASPRKFLRERSVKRNL